MSEKSVIINSLDRFDKVDFDALQADLYAYVSEALGNVLGQAEGCLNPFSVTFSTVGSSVYATFSAFAMVLKVPDLTRLGESTASSMTTTWRNHVVNFDPSVEPGEVLEYTALKAVANVVWGRYSGNPNTDRVGRTVTGYNAYNRFQSDMALPYLWARLYTNPESASTRRQWNAGLADETAYVATRRNVERVEFQFSALSPAVGTGNPWSRIASVVGWKDSGGTLTTPVIRPIYCWDNLAHYTATPSGESDTPDEDFREDSNRIGIAPLSQGVVNGLDTAGDLGIVRQLYLIRRAIDRMKNAGYTEADPGAELPWYYPPPNSLRGLGNDLTALTATVAGNASDISDLQSTAPTVTVRAERDSTAATYTVRVQVRGYSAHIGTLADSGIFTGHHSLELSTTTLTTLGLSAAEIALFTATGRCVPGAFWFGAWVGTVPNKNLEPPEVIRFTGGWVCKTMFRATDGTLDTGMVGTGWSVDTIGDRYVITLALW